MADILAKITRYKREEVDARRAKLPLVTLQKQASDASPVRGFAASLDEAVKADGLAIIGEIKKASPSKGLIRADFNPASLASAYHAGGAACLSVLTDRPSFQGEDRYLGAAREACPLPVLRKDFMIDEWQIFEARLLGADCILLILAILDDERARLLESIAYELGMGVLVETHDEEEVSRALALQSSLIGINNRDLRSFETSLDVTRRLAPMLEGEGRVVVSESGLYSHDDLLSLGEIGVKRFLIGEAIMRKPDVTAAMRSMLGKADG